MVFIRAEVTDVSDLSARLRRIVLDTPELGRLGLPDVADAAVGVYLPGPGLRHAPEPSADGASEGRNYSVREHDAAANRLTVDVVLHEHGLGTDWARRAATGDTVVLGHARSWYRPQPAARWQLLIADLAGLPAVARIIDESRSPDDLFVIVEVLDEADLEYLPPLPGTPVTAVGSGNGRAASRLAELVARQALPDGPGYCWFAGEAAQSRAVRKHLRAQGWTSDQFDIVGYWRQGSEDWDRRFETVADEVVAVYTAALAAGKSEKAASEEFDEALERAGL